MLLLFSLLPSLSSRSESALDNNKDALSGHMPSKRRPSEKKQDNKYHNIKDTSTYNK